MTTPPLAEYNSLTGRYTSYCQRCGKEIVDIYGIQTLPLDFTGHYCVSCQLDALESSKAELIKHKARLNAMIKCVESNIKILKKVADE